MGREAGKSWKRKSKIKNLKCLRGGNIPSILRHACSIQHNQNIKWLPPWNETGPNKANNEDNNWIHSRVDVKFLANSSSSLHKHLLANDIPPFFTKYILSLLWFITFQKSSHLSQSLRVPILPLKTNWCQLQMLILSIFIISDKKKDRKTTKEASLQKT